MGDRVRLYDNVRLVLGDPEQHPDTGLRLADDVIVNVGCYLSGEGGLQVDAGVLVGAGVKILSAGHAFDGAELDAAIWRNPLTYARVHVQCGAWLAAGVMLLPGVTVGAGAVVGAGSVVTRSVPDFAVAAGNPARVIRYRDGFQPQKSRFWFRTVRR